MTTTAVSERLSIFIQNATLPAYLKRELAEVLADMRKIEATLPELLNAAKLAEMMLGVEAQAHRENQQPKKAEAVEGAIRTIQATIAKVEGR